MISRTIGVREPIDGVVYPPADTLKRYIDEGILGFETLADAFRDAARKHPHHIALQSVAQSVSYQQLDEQTDRLAAALLQRGMTPLDPVVFQLNNCEELVMGWLACLKAGLIPICTLAAHRESEIGYLAEHAQAKLHFVQGDDPKFDDVAFANDMQQRVPSLRAVLQAKGQARDGAWSLHQLIDETSLASAQATLANVKLDPFQVAVYQLSGGTTGVPKIIPRMHNDYVCNMRSVASWLGYRSDDVLFMPFPMVHNLNMGCCFGPFLLTGATVTIPTSTSAEVLVDLISRTRPTWMSLNGAIVARLEVAVREGQINLAQVRGCIMPADAPKVRELLKVPVYQIFGMTEGVIMLTHAGHPSLALDTTVGQPVCSHDEVRLLVPETDTEVALGEVGEPVFKGPYTLHGYFKAEERNREAFTQDGFYRSGDLMQAIEIDGQRFYRFKGRLKDLISRGGEKINCQEVEMAVSRHPSVAGCAVVGMPDPTYGERACAFLVLRQGKTSPSVAELGEFLRESGLAKFKWPERVEVVDAFPMTLSGKLSKPGLRELLAKRTNDHHAPTA